MSTTSPELAQWCRQVARHTQDILRYVGQIRAGVDRWELLADTRTELVRLLDNPPPRGGP